MDEANYEAIARLQQNNWWYVTRRDLVDGVLGDLGPFECGLDLGCGFGANLPVLIRHCRLWSGVDTSAEAVAWCRSRGYDRVFQSDGTRLDAADSTFDLVTCLDVLEHLDDHLAIGEILRVLRPGGWLVATVPAHPYLWNENDEFSHHHRRYRRKDLDVLLQGFAQLRMSFWNMTTYLPLLLYAGFRRLRPATPRNNLDAVPGPANRPLTWALLIENRLRRWIPMPIGTSLVAVARAPGGE